MLEKVYESANKKIHIKPEFLEDTENKIIRQLNSTSHKRNLIYRYRLAVASLRLVIIIDFGLMPGGMLRLAYSKLLNAKKDDFRNKDTSNYGNTIGNIANFGSAVKKDNYIFFLQVLDFVSMILIPMKL